MRVLFVCIANVNRSQIAAAVFNRLTKHSRATSAGVIVKVRYIGTQISKDVHSPVIPMKEAGYDVSKAKRARLTRQMVKSVDKVVLIFGKKRHPPETLPKYLLAAPSLEWWDVPSIDVTAIGEEYRKQERKRIKVIEALVKDFIKRENLN